MFSQCRIYSAPPWSQFLQSRAAIVIAPKEYVELDLHVYRQVHSVCMNHACGQAKIRINLSTGGDPQGTLLVTKSSVRLSLVTPPIPQVTLIGYRRLIFFSLPDSDSVWFWLARDIAKKHSFAKLQYAGRNRKLGTSKQTAHHWKSETAGTSKSTCSAVDKSYSRQDRSFAILVH